MPEEYDQEQYADDSVSESDIDDLVNRANTAEAQNMQLNQALTSLSKDDKDDNFLHHQISTQELIEKLEHFYKGDFQGANEAGDYVWIEQEDKTKVTFNDYGVTSMMDIITKYIDKNTILSYYPEERIYEIIGDLGEELVLFILCNYEKIGMDTHYKKTKFRIVITTTLHIIESTYRRALRGRTMEDINQSKIIGQFGRIEQPQPQVMRQPRMMQRILGR